MTSADGIANALSKWTREGLDMIGGSDSHTLERLLAMRQKCTQEV